MVFRAQRRKCLPSARVPRFNVRVQKRNPARSGAAGNSFAEYNAQTDDGHHSVRGKNLAYLQFAFNHPNAVVETVFTQNEFSFAKTYEALVHMAVPNSTKKHGTPGSTRSRRVFQNKSLQSSPVRNRWQTERKNKNCFLSHQVKAEQRDWISTLLPELDEQRPDREARFREKWGKTFDECKTFSQYIADIRDDLQGNKYDLSPWKCQTNRLRFNGILLFNMELWLDDWGELDLHRLNRNDAVFYVHKHVMSRRWLELRVIAGSPRHNGSDHASTGILNEILNTFFDAERVPGEVFSEGNHTALLNDVREKIRREGISCTFFMNRTAVVLQCPVNPISG